MLASVTVTVYTVVTRGETVGPRGVQLYVYGGVPPAPLAVNVTDWPTQIVVPACGVTVSKDGSLMLKVVVEVQPIISVTNTE